jgi:LysR family transcriptional regulator, transcriptional activator for aaeXAB operon
MHQVEAFAIFVKVGELGSLSTAARLLGIPKARVSRSIARLESQLGVTLFLRTARRMVLTEVGAKLHSQAKALVEQLAGLRAEVEAYRGNPSGILRLGCPPSVAPHISAVLPDFLQAFPAITLRLKVADRILPQPGGFDVVLHAGWLADSSLVARKLGQIELMLVATPKYLEQHGTPRSPEDLASHTLFGNFSASRSAAGSDPGQLPIRVAPLELARGDARFAIAQTGRFSSNDFRLIRNVVASGMGIAPLPTIDIDHDLRTGQLIRVLPGYDVHDQPSLYAILPGRGTVPPKVRAFLEFLQERVQETVARRSPG